MSVEKNTNARIQHKHDIEENWRKATNFIPKAGELIIYDIDENGQFEDDVEGDSVIENINGYYQTVDDGSFRKSSKTIIIIDENNVKIPITLTLSSKERKILINAVSSTNYVRPIVTDVINTYIPNDSSGPQFDDPYPETPVSITPRNVNT